MSTVEFEYGKILFENEGCVSQLIESLNPLSFDTAESYTITLKRIVENVIRRLGYAPDPLSLSFIVLPDTESVDCVQERIYNGFPPGLGLAIFVDPVVHSVYFDATRVTQGLLSQEVGKVLFLMNCSLPPSPDLVDCVGMFCRGRNRAFQY